jgi:hypothetical protein
LRMGALLAYLLLLAATGMGAGAQALAPANLATPDVQATPGAWTLVVLPDVQSYSDSSANAPILRQMTQWIAQNKQPLNIQLVLQEGDIVYQNGVLLASQSSGDQNSARQWANAREAFTALDGVVPYIVVPGNHDYGVTNADNRETHLTRYFHPTDNPLTDFTQGGILLEMGPNAYGELTLENAAYTLTAPDGRKLLILALEFGPRQAAVDWANTVVQRPRYRDYTKVLLTHAYLYEDGTRFDWAAKGKEQSDSPHGYRGTNSDTHDGEELWNELVRKYPNFELVLCGHVGGDMVDYLVSKNDSGQDVHQLVFNAQFLPQGGQGWLRLLEFQPDGKTVHVRTYSPYFALDGDPATAQWRTGAADDFTFELTPAP